MPKMSNNNECVTQEISKKAADKKNSAVHLRGITNDGNEKMNGGSIMEPKVNGRNVEILMSASSIKSLDGYTSSEDELVCFI